MEKGSFWFASLGSLAVLAGVVVAGSSSLVACSSSNDSTFGDGVDSGPPDPGPISPLVPEAGADGGGEGGAKQCTPSIPAEFKPSWTPPTKATPAKCTADELQGYWDACLKDASKKEPCVAFANAHKDCTACIEPADKSGPVQWHQERLYYTLNVAGCIALQQPGKTGPDDCGGAYNAAVQCTRESCQGCFATGGTFTEFSECQKKVSSQGVCASYQTVQSDACQGIKEAGKPTLQCFLGNGEALETLFVRVEGFFCGP